MDALQGRLVILQAMLCHLLAAKERVEDGCSPQAVEKLSVNIFFCLPRVIHLMARNSFSGIPRGGSFQIYIFLI